MLKEREQNLRNEISKMSFALESFENGLTCIVCLLRLENPVITIPCGHVACGNCLNLTANCSQCDTKTKGLCRVSWVDHFVEKISFQKQVLDSMKLLVEKSIMF